MDPTPPLWIPTLHPIRLSACYSCAMKRQRSNQGEEVSHSLTCREEDDITDGGLGRVACLRVCVSCPYTIGGGFQPLTLHR